VTLSDEVVREMMRVYWDKLYKMQNDAPMRGPAEVAVKWAAIVKQLEAELAAERERVRDLVIIRNSELVSLERAESNVTKLRAGLQRARNLMGPDEVIDAVLEETK